MKKYSTRSTILAVVFALAISSIALAMPPAEKGRKNFMIYGRVLKIDQEARTLMVADKHSEKLYLVAVPEGMSVRITFGASAGLSSAEFKDVQKNNRIVARVAHRGSDHLARAEDGRQLIAVTVTE
jgi:hypothetical protein